MLKVGVANERLKELQVTLEMTNLSKEQAEKECRLEQKKTECLSLEVKRLELMVSSDICPIYMLFFPDACGLA